MKVNTIFSESAVNKWSRMGFQSDHNTFINLKFN